MAYSLSNKCAKSLCKRAVLIQLIIENVVTCFLEHSVEAYTHQASRPIQRYHAYFRYSKKLSHMIHREPKKTLLYSCL